MLDDLKYIHEKDSQDALGIAEKQWQQLDYDFSLGSWTPNYPVENIVFAGMGGSALAALIAKSWPGTRVPFDIVRDYNIPDYVSNNTLFIASSYSGNTEETIEALNLAKARSAQVIVITSGGKLQDIANHSQYPILLLPSGFQPRFATLYSLNALITILAATDIIEGESTREELDKAKLFLKEATLSWRADIKTIDNPAKKLALELSGKTPVIYSGPKLAPVAYKWKISFNENAKNVAWCNQFPEFNHNEFLGWTSHPIDKPYSIIELISNTEHERTQKRFEISNKLLSGRWPSPHLIHPEGESLLQQLLYAMALGDFVSLYLAMLNGLNPTPVEIIERLKNELNN